MRPLKYLTGQAEFAISEAGKAKRRAAFSTWIGLAAASPQSQVAVCLNQPIVIWYGEELTQ